MLQRALFWHFSSPLMFLYRSSIISTPLTAQLIGDVLLYAVSGLSFWEFVSVFDVAETWHLTLVIGGWKGIFPSWWMYSWRGPFKCKFIMINLNRHVKYFNRKSTHTDYNHKVKVLAGDSGLLGKTAILPFWHQMPNETVVREPSGLTVEVKAWCPAAHVENESWRWWKTWIFCAFHTHKSCLSIPLCVPPTQHSLWLTSSLSGSKNPRRWRSLPGPLTAGPLPNCSLFSLLCSLHVHFF